MQGIALQPDWHGTPRAVRAAAALAGRGLAGDVHADDLSPRQVLLAGAPAYARHRLPPRTLRENLLLDIDTADFASGMLLRVGAEAVLRLTFACEACGYLDARQPGVAAAIGRARGMLARVVRGGPITAGDPVVVLPARLPAWDDDWRARVAAILARVPPGMVVDYRQLARLAGVQPVYCRTFPALARKLGFGHAAVAMAGRPDLPRWQGGELFEDAGQPIG
ncbi:MOSC domain-containing protein [Pseudoduganella umbonata]|uniref:MOSC domain-containing protein n=1 Tax=Pseudoduganella umbonata TaxID=864828 RepID=UPI001E605CAB|nr:MOSC domain-containing protein [Pseudoduganella umbonata]